MAEQQESSAQYLISTVSKRSGLKTDLIRAWERRYQAVTPTRTEGGQRVYNDIDIARLKLLNQVTSNGHSISQVARLSLDELRNLLKKEETPLIEVADTHQSSSDKQYLTEDYIEKCYAAVIEFDAKKLERHFENAIVELEPQFFIENLLEPLLNKIGSNWQAGLLRPAHEHMTTALIRSMAYILRTNNPAPDNAPSIVISTPISQLHELGALMASIIAEFKGWHVTYLGANLPAEEIAAACKYTGSIAVALGISCPHDDIVVPKEIRRLKKLLGNDATLLAGGKCADNYQLLLNELNVTRIENYSHFKDILDQLKNSHLSKPMPN
ncbi:MAG: MerR family transcriptional regulator [Methylococcaceae bacterium]|jgi:DNA-binding transcriptional MerR regulator/methylmalonyl-CoA mutase cobalamin-binding subunit